MTKLLMDSDRDSVSYIYIYKHMYTYLCYCDEGVMAVIMMMMTPTLSVFDAGVLMQLGRQSLPVTCRVCIMPTVRVLCVCVS